MCQKQGVSLPLWKGLLSLLLGGIFAIGGMVLVFAVLNHFNLDEKYAIIPSTILMFSVFAFPLFLLRQI